MKTIIQIKSISENFSLNLKMKITQLKILYLRLLKQKINLNYSNLRGSDLRGSNLSGSDLKYLISQTSILPEGELIVWKKLRNNLIAKLLIPAKAKRVNAISSRKCRFEFVKTLAIYNSKKKVNKGTGIYNSITLTKYIVGEFTYPDSFDNSPLIECSNGIHAFITKLEAQNYE
jgi:hypothetical protein